MPLADYRQHWDRFHAVNLVTGERPQYQPPKTAARAPAPGTDWIGYGASFRTSSAPLFRRTDPA